MGLGFQYGETNKDLERKGGPMCQYSRINNYIDVVM